MEWINQFQRDLGEPVIGFVSENFILIAFLVIVALGVLFRSTGSGGVSLGVTIGGDGDGDSGGDGGGDGGGGGD